MMTLRLTLFAIVYFSVIIAESKFGLALTIALFFLNLFTQMQELKRSNLEHEKAWKPMVALSFFMGALLPFPFFIDDIMGAHTPSETPILILWALGVGAMTGAVASAIGMIVVNQFYSRK